MKRNWWKTVVLLGFAAGMPSEVARAAGPAVTGPTFPDSRKMYWADPVTNKIHRANLDGSQVEDVVSTGVQGPWGVALDLAAGKVYWADYHADKIRRANLDGSDVEDLVTTGLLQPLDIDIDSNAGKMYWADGTTNKIQRANLDGSEVEDLVVTGLVNPVGVALDLVAEKIYWTNWRSDTIQRSNLDGSHVEDLVTTGLDRAMGIALDVDAGRMYWADEGTRKIQRADLDGSNVEDLISVGLSNPAGIALDLVRGKMYWTDLGADKIQRADLDGSNIEDLITTGLGAPRGIALDLRGPSIVTSLDIRPRSCPNRMNRRGRGVLSVAVAGSASFDAITVDPMSLELKRADGLGGAAYPITWPDGTSGKIKDVTTSSIGGPCDCQSRGRDGFEDLVIRFSTHEVVDALDLGHVPHGTLVTLTVHGHLLDGTSFSASDCVRMTGRGPAAPRDLFNGRGPIPPINP